MEFEEKKHKISFLGGPTTPTYSTRVNNDHNIYLKLSLTYRN